ncbi:MAG TPA: hypothetical protein PKD64_08635 [Pirellulaceae bacterium]|nr:hypothetical protein [Pirellulaceae bacterium]HMO92253.1 hypothetical protein [Pirellulaceae bacterium]HMP70069.1 hypothetical protein [Pirellulaceae bacterium]
MADHSSSIASGHDVEHIGQDGSVRPSYDDVNVSVLILVGVIASILTFVTIAFVQGLYYRWASAFEDLSPNPAVVQSIEAQKAKLSANPDTGRLSIEEAMAMVAESHAQAGDVSVADEDGGQAH